MPGPQFVVDKKAETRISISNYLQALLLAVTLGYGGKIIYSIDSLLASVNLLITLTSVQQKEIAYNAKDVQQLKVDVDKNKEEITKLRVVTDGISRRNLDI